MFPPFTSSARGHVTEVPPHQKPLEVVVFVEQLLSAAALMAMENFKHFLVVLSVAAAAGLVSIIFVLIWVLHFREGLAWDGGPAEFNWHPVLMVIGFIFLQGTGEKVVFLRSVLVNRNVGVVLKMCKHDCKWHKKTRLPNGLRGRLPLTVCLYI